MHQFEFLPGRNQTTSYSKVIKGEVHNVLSVFRSDPRNTQKENHPVISSMRDLNEHLTSQELEMLSARAKRSTPSSQLESVTFLSPFCTAISNPDVSAPVTGACIGALHKFLLYGFVDPKAVRDAKEGITSVARAIRLCTFEESSQMTSSSYSRLQKNSSVQITDEEVVLRLLSLASLVIRSAAGIQLLDSRDVVGIFETTLHVATQVESKASGLLRSAAIDCLRSIIVVVFGSGEMVIQVGGDQKSDNDPNSSDDGDDSSSQGSDDLWCDSVTVDPLLAEEDRKHSLLLAEDGQIDQQKIIGNFPGKPLDEELPAHISIMSRLASLLNLNDNSEQVCIQALQLINIALETAPPDHLTSYPKLLGILKNTLCRHLLYLSTSSDLVIMTQTLRVIFNLFNSIKNHLKVQLEVFLTSVHLRILGCNTKKAFTTEQKEVALESLLEFCQEPSLMQDLYVNYDCDVQCTNLFETICKVLAMGMEEENPKTDDDPIAEVQIPSVLNHLCCESILAVIDSIARRCDVPFNNDRPSINAYFKDHSISPVQSASLDDTDSIDTDSYTSDDLSAPKSGSSTSWLDDARLTTSKVLIERKRKKRKLAEISAKFNQNALGKEWIAAAEEMGIFPTPASARSIASFLYSQPKLDKTQIGLYLSKGPKEKYPFHAETLESFSSLFDFGGLPFSSALRAFLLRFRLPGEAQCIDRLMEAFAVRLHEQNHEDEAHSIFMSSDSIFVLAFSTIMLNTDLHNPTIKDDRRMTTEEFIRNNRGINDGKDFPIEFMKDLYNQIKNDEIQVQKDFSDDPMDMMMTKSSEVAEAVFTTHDSSICDQAGMHERDMFLSIVSLALKNISLMFVRTDDVSLMMKIVKGIQQIATTCLYFQIDTIYNEALGVLLEFGRDFLNHVLLISCSGSALELAAASDQLRLPTNTTPVFRHDVESRNDETKLLLSPSQMVTATAIQTKSIDEKGLVALESALFLAKSHPGRLREALPNLMELIFLLRDANALPHGLSDLDDFANSEGTLLPPSPYAISSEREAKLYLSKMYAPKKLAPGRIWLLSKMFSDYGDSNGENPQKYSPKDCGESPGCFSHGHLLSVEKRNELLLIGEKVSIGQFLIGRKDRNSAKQMLCTLLDETKPKAGGDIMFQHHAVFALELSARLLFCNMDFASELFSLFVPRLTDILTSEKDVHASANPFLMERSIITILRFCIHMIDRDDMRQGVLSLLRLLLEIPEDIFIAIVDRVACGMAIIVHCALANLTDLRDWDLIGQLLDSCAKYTPLTIFDGVTSCVGSRFPTRLGGFVDAQSIIYSGASLIVQVLLKFTFGSYGNDLTLSTATIPFLEQAYEYLHHLQIEGPYDSGIDEELWISCSKAFYSVALGDDAHASRYAIDVLEHFVLSNHVEEISVISWLTLMEGLTIRRPSLEFTAPRHKIFNLLCRLILIIIPKLQCSEQGRFAEIGNMIVFYVQENIQFGPNHALYENSVQVLTNTVNVIAMLTFDNEVSKSIHNLSHSFSKELEKIGRDKHHE